MSKMVYFFGGRSSEGNAAMRNLLGGKGANLAEMARFGIDVPAGFTISTEVCDFYHVNGGSYPEKLQEEVRENLQKVEKVMGAKFGSSKNPLLVSVRSGARVSMPGMMDSVLNIGLNDESVKGFISRTKNERVAYDSYRRFLQMFGDVVLGVDGERFESLIEAMKKENDLDSDTDLTVSQLVELADKFRQVIAEETGKPFPENTEEQLWAAIGAVFRSWDTPRAVSYRKLNRIPDNWGTAVNVQAMVFGNMGDNSGTGVAFTRDPASGENIFYGEYLMNAQGEDVVAGVRTPLQINRVTKKDASLPSLEEEMPDIYASLEEIRAKLEKHYRDMQDIEFTIQERKLWMLQTRTGKRTAIAAIKMAVDMQEEGLINEEEAVLRVEPQQLDQLLHPIFDPAFEKTVIAKGLNASPGAATGKVVFSADEAANFGRKGEKVILVRLETSPEDVHGMAASQGVLTARGGMTSHAAVVARGMGKCCVVGCSALNIDYGNQRFKAGGITVKKGDYISLDGTTGEAMLGEVPVIDSEIMRVTRGEKKPAESELYLYYEKLMSWVDKIKVLGVRTNADTPQDAELARRFGAEGIGLARTEHMFFGEERLPVVRRMITASTEEERKNALDELLPMQKQDFKGILKAMDGLPVIIRLLDPPLHEFLPSHEQLALEISRLKSEGVPQAELSAKEKSLSLIEKLQEMNPMLGHRGCRLGVTFPEIYKMQARAIFEAAAELVLEGKKPMPEVMIPLVGHVNELRITRRDVEEVAEKVMREKAIKINYMVGTMIELPRAALTADEIAEEADFFSYGTNDLTQMTFGFSRDDIEGKFLPEYIEKKIFTDNPFAVLDRKGVGELMRMGIQKGRRTKPDLEIGICGEHGGDPSSVEYCNGIGMNYVSCSPFRVPVARLSAAHAVIKCKKIHAQ